MTVARLDFPRFSVRARLRFAVLPLLVIAACQNLFQPASAASHCIPDSGPLTESSSTTYRFDWGSSVVAPVRTRWAEASGIAIVTFYRSPPRRLDPVGRPDLFVRESRPTLDVFHAENDRVIVARDNRSGPFPLNASCSDVSGPDGSPRPVLLCNGRSWFEAKVSLDVVLRLEGGDEEAVLDLVVDVKNALQNCIDELRSSAYGGR